MIFSGKVDVMIKTLVWGYVCLLILLLGELHRLNPPTPRW
jgi:hypothetical protein